MSIQHIFFQPVGWVDFKDVSHPHLSLLSSETASLFQCHLWILRAERENLTQTRGKLAQLSH